MTIEILLRLIDWIDCDYGGGGREEDMAQAVEEWYKQMPIITRSYLTAAVITTVGCSLDVCAQFANLFFGVKFEVFWISKPFDFVSVRKHLF